MLRTIDYSDFVWRVFLVIGSKGRPLVVAFISTEDKIVVSDVETGETAVILFGRLIFAGHISLYPFPVVILASGEEDISFTNAESGKVCRIIEGGFGRVFRAVVSHDLSPCLIFTTWNHQNRRSTIQTYELGDVMPHDTNHMTTAISLENEPCDLGKMRIMFEGDSRDGVSSLVVSRKKDPLICSGHYDFVVRVWDLFEKKLIFTLKDHIDWVVSVAIWKGAEPLAVSGSSDGTIKVWDLQTGNLLTTCEGHLRDVWSVTVTEGPEHLIVSASVDRTVRSWDINDFLKDLKWERRKYFCIFLNCCGFIGREMTKYGCHVANILTGANDSDFECIDSFKEAEKEKNEEDLGTAALNTKMGIDVEVSGSEDLMRKENDGYEVRIISAVKNSNDSTLPSISLDDVHLTQSLKSVSHQETKYFLKLVFQSVNLCREIASFL